VLRQKGRKRAERAALVQQLSAEEIPFVAQEDAWEERLRKLAEEEGIPHAIGPSSREGTYHQTVAVGIRYLVDALAAEKADMIARGRAMLKIVDAERDLAGKEKEERKRLRRAAWEARTMEGEKTTP